MKRLSANDRGFTLVELMIVVAVISILASVAMPAYFNYLSRSRQSEVVGELMAMKAAQERFFAENGGYSGNLFALDTYAGAGTLTIGRYRYTVAPTTPIITAGTLQAFGDLNGDGAFNDGWQVPIQDLLAKPENFAPGNEGFSLSFLGLLLD